MWNLLRFGIAFILFGTLVASTTAAGILGSLLGENDVKNNKPSVPLIGALGLGSNREEHHRQDNNYNQPINNNNANRGLLSILGGGNANVNGPNTNNLNNLNRYPNIGHKNPSNNMNDLKNQLKEAQQKLERVKELNRLKEQQKLKDEEKNNQEPVNLDREELESDNHNSNVNGGTERAKGTLKSLTKRKFYFIVKPVVPETEAGNFDETVYYAD